MHSIGGSDAVHSNREGKRYARPLRRNDAVKGHLYQCEWLADVTEGDVGAGKVVTSRTHALWVPDANLLFQWPMPRGKMQVVERESFPPEPDKAWVEFIEDRNVPYSVIQEARRYLKNQKHIHGQEAVIQTVIARITSSAIRSEGWLQDAAAKAGLRP